MLGRQSVEPLLHEELLMLQLALLQFALEDGIVFYLLDKSVSDLIHLILKSNVFFLNAAEVAYDVSEQLLLLLAALLG